LFSLYTFYTEVGPQVSFCCQVNYFVDYLEMPFKAATAMHL